MVLFLLHTQVAGRLQDCYQSASKVKEEQVNCMHCAMHYHAGFEHVLQPRAFLDRICLK